MPRTHDAACLAARLIVAVLTATTAASAMALENKAKASLSKKLSKPRSVSVVARATPVAVTETPGLPKAVAEPTPAPRLGHSPAAELRPTSAQPAIALAKTAPAGASPESTAPLVAAAAPQNPYLAGWYRPVPAAALPAMAVGQLNYNARYVSDAVTSIPAKVADALPSIKTVHPTGGRDLVVANLKCPAEMIAGQYFIPANALREGINGLFNRLNDSQLLKFDIQLVCS